MKNYSLLACPDSYRIPEIIGTGVTHARFIRKPIPHSPVAIDLHLPFGYYKPLFIDSGFTCFFQLSILV